MALDGTVSPGSIHFASLNLGRVGEAAWDMLGQSENAWEE